MNTPTPNDNNLSSLLADLQRGKVWATANETFTGLVQSVREHGKAGELILKVKVTPATGGDASRVTVAATVDAKTPAAAPYKGIYFTTDEGRVQKNDPDQAEMNLQPLPTPAPAVAAIPVSLPESAAL